LKASAGGDSARRLREAPVSQLLVRDLDPAIVERLKQRAKRHGRSLQREAKSILEAAATLSPEEARQMAARWRRRLAGATISDSADLVREDRDR
jgi:antitoxin FitA